MGRDREEVTSETLLRDKTAIEHILQKQNYWKKTSHKKGRGNFLLPLFSENFLIFLLTHAIIFRPSVISLRDLSVNSAVLYQICVF